MTPKQATQKITNLRGRSWIAWFTYLVIAGHLIQTLHRERQEALAHSIAEKLEPHRLELEKLNQNLTNPKQENN